EPGRMTLMSRPVLLLFSCLAVVLGGFGLLADRALVQEAAASAALSSVRADQDARTAALSIRGALGQIEQDLLAGRAAGAGEETLVLMPALSVSSGRTYRDRPRSDLVALLLSTETTPSGLPEAVVAAVALGTPASRREVRERLLTGQLPELARLLDAEHDARVSALQRRLRSVPDRAELPEAPSFRRILREGDRIEAWTRRGRTAIRYAVPVRTLFETAGVAQRASLATGLGGATASGTAVPDVEGLHLTLRAAGPSRGRLLAARGLLWLAVAACLTALGLVQ